METKHNLIPWKIWWFML